MKMAAIIKHLSMAMPPTIVVAVAAAPTVMMATAAHMAVTMTVAALDLDDGAIGSDIYAARLSLNDSPAAPGHHIAHEKRKPRLGVRGFLWGSGE